MIDSDVLARRLERLREYVGYLHELRSKPKEDFTNDPFIYGNAERYLQLSIQCMLDIGNHIISSEQLDMRKNTGISLLSWARTESFPGISRQPLNP